MSYYRMRYIPYDIKHPKCRYVLLSNRAYNSIINETFEYGTDETGGLLLGYILGSRWYVVEVIDGGTNDTVHRTGLFQWNKDHVNKMAARIQKLYNRQPTILGFWHRHPGSMDFFSDTDEQTTQKDLRNARHGLVSMLINIDPALRMTAYYANEDYFMQVPVDVGDEYFPVEFLEYASPQLISQRHAANQRGREVPIFYKRVLLPPTAPGMKPRLSVVAINDAEEEAPQVEIPVRRDPAVPKQDPPKEPVQETPVKPEPPKEPMQEAPAQPEPPKEPVQEAPAQPEPPEVPVQEPSQAPAAEVQPQEPAEAQMLPETDAPVAEAAPDAEASVPQAEEPDAQPEAPEQGEEAAQPVKKND